MKVSTLKLKGHYGLKISYILYFLSGFRQMKHGKSKLSQPGAHIRQCALGGKNAFLYFCVVNCLCLDAVVSFDVLD